LHTNEYIVLTNNINNKVEHERTKSRNSQLPDLQDVKHDEFTHKSTMSVSCPGPVGSNGSSTSFVHASDDLLELVPWNNVPFNDERIFQFLQGVEWIMIPSNLSV
jgi:hypothetical protein